MVLVVVVSFAVVVSVMVVSVVMASGTSSSIKFSGAPVIKINKCSVL